MFPLLPVSPRNRRPDIFHDFYGDSAGKALVREIAEFMIYWELRGLDSWDLPNPQGPLYGMGGQLNHWVVDPEAMGESLYVPHWYKVGSKDKVLSQLEENQQRVGKERCLDGEEWPLGCQDIYAPMFHCIHYERAIRQRFAFPKSWAGTSSEALSAWIENRFPVSKDAFEKRQKGKVANGPEARIHQYRSYAKSRLAGKLPDRLKTPSLRTRMSDTPI